MFTPEDWDAINADAEKYFKRDDRGLLDDAKNKITQGASTINDAASNAGGKISDVASTAGGKISETAGNVGDKISGAGESISNQWNDATTKVNDTWTEIKVQYNDTKEKIETIIKIIKILIWVSGGLLILAVIGSIALCIYAYKHHNTKNKKQKQRIEDLTNAVNKLTKVYCRQNNIDYVENEEVVRLTVEGEEEEEEEEKPALDKVKPTYSGLLDKTRPNYKITDGKEE